MARSDNEHRSAKGMRGVLLFMLDTGEEEVPFIRVYDENDKKKYTDYRLRHNDLAIEITTDYAVVTDDPPQITYPPRRKGETDGKER